MWCCLLIGFVLLMKIQDLERMLISKIDVRLTYLAEKCMILLVPFKKY